MLKLIALIQAYNTKEDGATAIEYALIAAGISLVIATAVYTLGGTLEAKFDDIDTQLNSTP